MKKLIRRALADADVSAALDYYLVNAPEYVLDLLNDIEQAYQHIQQYPATGSLRYAYDLSVPELRFWRCEHFPCLIFYVEYSTHIEVWRLLHNKRDIPHSLQEED